MSEMALLAGGVVALSGVLLGLVIYHWMRTSGSVATDRLLSAYQALPTPLAQQQVLEIVTCFEELEENDQAMLHGLAQRLCNNRDRIINWPVG